MLKLKRSLGMINSRDLFYTIKYSYRQISALFHFRITNQRAHHPPDIFTHPFTVQCAIFNCLNHWSDFGIVHLAGSNPARPLAASIVTGLQEKEAPQSVMIYPLVAPFIPQNSLQKLRGHPNTSSRLPDYNQS